MRRSCFEIFETVVVVTLITGLVWLYAEGAIVDRHPNERVAVEFVAAGGVPMQIEPQTVVALVTFRASGPVYQRFQAKTTNQTVKLPIEAGVGDGVGQASTVDLRARLDAELFAPLGVAIDEIDVALVPVVAERLVPRTLPIVVRDEGLNLRGPATVDPPAVTVNVPESVGLLLDAQAGLPGSAIAASVDLSRAVADNPPVPGEADVVTLAIEMPVVAGQSLGLPRVREADVSYTLSNREGRLRLASVPLRRLTPFEFPFSISVQNNQKVLSDVELTGPTDTLAEIESGAVAVWAELHFLDATRLTAGPMTVDVTFHVPAGVTAELRQVNVVLSDPVAASVVVE